MVRSDDVSFTSVNTPVQDWGGERGKICEEVTIWGNKSHKPQTLKYMDMYEFPVAAIMN